MNELVLIVLVLLVCFSFVLFFGAPYLPSKKIQVDAALSLMKLQKGDTFIELGCGDGKVLKAAAKRGIRGVGYELNPLLFVFAKISLYKYRKITSVKLENFWTADWPESKAIYVFLLDKFMPKLDKKIAEYTKKQDISVTLVSFVFKIPGKKISMSKNGLFVYHYK